MQNECTTRMCTTENNMTTYNISSTRLFVKYFYYVQIPAILQVYEINENVVVGDAPSAIRDTRMNNH